jgi:hypothetical protein
MQTEANTVADDPPLGQTGPENASEGMWRRPDLTWVQHGEDMIKRDVPGGGEWILECGLAKHVH